MYSVDSIKRTVHLAFHGLKNGIFNRDFLKLLLKTVRLIETVLLIEQAMDLENSQLIEQYA